MSNIRVTPRVCFASPVLEGMVEKSQELNNALKSRFLTLEKSGYKNKTKINTTLGDIYDSPGDLFSQVKYPEVMAIRKLMNGVLTSWILETSTFTVEDLEKNYKFEFESWFHITRYGGAKSLHNHGQCSWSMVYYVDAGDEPTKEFSKSGFLQLYDPRNIRQNPEDFGYMRMKPLYDYGGFSIKPKAGKFVIFPGYLDHEVVTYFGRSERIMIALNCMIRKRE